MKKLFFLFHFLFFSCSIFSQQLSFRNYTVEDGLAGSVVNNVLQDSKGYIWFATGTGISRFDGINFKNFTSQNGLPDNGVLKMYEDKKGRIWFFSFTGFPAYYFEEKIRTVDSSGILREINLTTFLEDSCGNLWLGTHADGLFKIENNHLSQFKNFKDYLFNEVDALMEGSSHQLLVSSDSGIFLLENNCNQASISVRNIPTKDTSRRKMIEQLNARKHNLFLDASQFNPSADLSQNIFLKNLKSKIVSSFLEDREKNIWITTLLNGVYFLPYYSREFFTYTTADGLSDNNISTIACDKKRNIWIGAGTGKLNFVKDNTISNIKEKTSGFFSDKINCMLLHSDGSLWCGTDGGIKIFRNGVLVRNLEVRNVGSLAEATNGIVLAGTITGILSISKNEIKNISRQLGQKQFSANSIFVESDSMVWIGNKDGLWKLNNHSLNRTDPNNELLSTAISSIKKSSGNILWLGLQNNGIVAVDNKTIHHIAVADGLCDNRCNSIFIDEQNNPEVSGLVIWVATKKGISKIHIKDKESWKFSIKNFTREDGLSSAEVNDILKSGDTVWAATVMGLCRFNEKNIFVSNVAPPVYITGIKINENDSLVKAAYQLNYTENNIQIDFTGLCYGIAGKINYKYMLEGIDTVWRFTNQPRVQFPLLPPNKYSFTVSAMNKDGFWNHEPASIRFTIAPPFWQTLWFKIIILILLIISLIVFVSYTAKYFKMRERKRTELKHRLAAAEQKALRAQMNPHFIFNALNSIQRFIVENDPLSANEYLAKFGKLIRRILDNSKRAEISIADELETLKLYLAMESLRFENKFEYTMDIDPAIDKDNCRIPPMLIQPYVENAIWHGLMNKPTPGNLQIKMKLTDRVILCTIEDNGVGRQKAMEIKSKHKEGHQSAGMQMTKERLEILNAQRKEKFQLQIIDLSDEKNEPSGTRVEIKIPVDF